MSEGNSLMTADKLQKRSRLSASRQWTALHLLFVICYLSFVNFAAAFTGPTCQPPPTGTCNGSANSDSSGNIGIGATATTTYKLHVGGSINTTGSLCLSADCKSAWSQVGGGGTNNWTLSGASLYPTSTSYNVGIGTTSPSYKLGVTGDIQATGSIYGTYAGAISSGNVSSGAFGSNTGGGNYSFPANVSIGTTTVGSTLTVAGNIEMQVNDPVAVFYDTGAGGTIWKIKNGVAGNGLMTFTDNDTARVTFKNTGEVGIGTTGPVMKLDVTNGTAVTGANSSNPTVLNVTGANNTLTGGAATAYFVSNTGMASDTGGSIAFSGLGTTANNASVINWGIIKGAKETGVSTNYNGYLAFGTQNHNAGAMVERMRIDSQGNVGIGTTNPSTALQVVGTITGTTKNFEIDHPTKPGMKLVHSTVEGPEVAVFYRGESKLVHGNVVVILPEYFEALTRKEGRTVQLTAKNGWSPLWVDGEVTAGRFMVKADSGNSNQQFFWEVKAVRSDVNPLVVEKPRAFIEVDPAL